MVWEYDCVRLNVEESAESPKVVLWRSFPLQYQDPCSRRCETKPTYADGVRTGLLTSKWNTLNTSGSMWSEYGRSPLASNIEPFAPASSLDYCIAPYAHWW
jgi:hypothetical protein